MWEYYREYYIGNYIGNYIGDYIGNYIGDYIGNYRGNYIGNFGMLIFNMSGPWSRISLKVGSGRFLVFGRGYLQEFDQEAHFEHFAALAADMGKNKLRILIF